MSSPSLTPTSSTLGALYGDPEAGDPIQYDALRIEHDQGAVEIVVYHRAILLFRTDSEAVRRVHRFTRCAAGSQTSCAPPSNVASRRPAPWACPDSVDTCVMLLAPSARSAARKQRG